jgi:nitrate/nitrite transport system substrate-binding protein
MKNQSRNPVRLGFVPLSDCAPIAIASELGFFEKHGVAVELSREAGWATVRDKLIYREMDVAATPAPMVVAACLGLGSIQTDCVTGLVLNLHGNGITLSNALWEAGVRDGHSLREHIRSERSGRKLTFGVVFPYSSHNFILRSWLSKHGIDPDRDVQIAVVPPPQMPANLKLGNLDGYCVGEPYNSMALLNKTGWCVAISAEIAPMHPEKVLMTRADFAAKEEGRHLALIAALREACDFCQDPANRLPLMEILAGPRYLNLAPKALEKLLASSIDFGHGRVEPSVGFHVFSGGNANEPDSVKAGWVLTRMRQMGMIPGETLVEPKESAAIFRADIYRQSTALLGTVSNKPTMKTNIESEKSALPSRSSQSPRSVSRREFLSTSAKGISLAALFAGLPKSWVGSVYAAEAPEATDLKLGMIALTDCSPIVIAHEKGLFKKYGINSTVIKGASWAAIRDSLSNGDIQATHMLLGMPIASTMGLGGAPKIPMVVPWILNRNGQAITLKKELAGKVAADPKVLKPLVDAAKASGNLMTFAMTFPPGTHAMWLRYWLAAGGINPGNAESAGADVSLVTIPPPQMVANMKVGKMDGFCVGEPWNARAINEEIGFTAATTQAIWKDHPEKVCAFTEEFAARNPKTVKAVLKALHEASTWLDKMENREEQAKIVSAATYINCPPESILGRLQGKYIMGDGRKLRDPDYMIFSDRNCNYPQAKYGKWWLTQLRRWGFTNGAPDYEGITKKVMRGDLYEEAMKELGVTGREADNSAETLFDGVKFDPKGDLEAYAAGFAVKTLKG